MKKPGTNRQGLALATLFVVCGSLSACATEQNGPPAASPPSPAAAQPKPIATDASGAAKPAQDVGAIGQSPPHQPVASQATGPQTTEPQATESTLSGTIDAVPAGLAKHLIVFLDHGAAPPAQVTQTVDQQNMTFMPYLTVIPAGGKVIFRNSDPFPHNVFAPGPDHFDLGMIPHGGARSHVFKTPGFYTLLCNVHPGMVAYVAVVPSTQFVTADAGKFKLEHVANGSYTVSAWGPKLQTETQSVTVSGNPVTLNFHLHRGE